MTVHWQSHGSCYQIKLSQKPLMDIPLHSTHFLQSNSSSLPLIIEPWRRLNVKACFRFSISLDKKKLTFTSASLNNILTLVKMDRTLKQKNVFKYTSNINLSFTMLCWRQSMVFFYKSKLLYPFSFLNICTNISEKIFYAMCIWILQRV